MINRLLAFLVKHLDRYLMGLISALLLMGLITLFSASGASAERVMGQAINICAALMVMWIAANVPLHYLSRIALPLYVVGLTLLIGVALAG
jgi:rod shape determining protein RodA